MPQKCTHQGRGRDVPVQQADGRQVQGPRCQRCEILLDVPCTHPACDGHLHASVGAVCRYCATDERRKTLFVRAVAPLFCSSVGDIGHGEDCVRGALAQVGTTCLRAALADGTVPGSRRATRLRESTRSPALACWIEE